jgi:hypothetical protein
MNKKINNFNSQNLVDGIQQALTKTILKIQFENDCSEMTFDELEVFFDYSLSLGVFPVIPLSKKQQIKSLSEFKMEVYNSFFNSSISMPLNEENYDLILNLLKDKQNENFVDDWKQFIDSYLYHFLKEEYLFSEIKIRNRIKKLRKNPEKWFIDLIKEARRAQEEWEKETLVKRKRVINGYQNERFEFFGQTSEKVKDEILPFEIFPKGGLTTEQFIHKLKHSGFKISYEDEARLRKIEKTFPNFKNRCVGKNDFKEYVVYRFENTDVVIAEKPAYGNATYLIKGDWEKEVKTILQMSKLEARKLPQTQFVFHRDESRWIRKLENKFYDWRQLVNLR